MSGLMQDQKESSFYLLLSLAEKMDFQWANMNLRGFSESKEPLSNILLSILSNFENEKIQLVCWIEETLKLRYPATYQKIGEFIEDKFGKHLSLDTIRHMVYSME